ncbi:hypothetical protein B2J86_00580 [Acidovorax sp. SRB_14]|uniref:tyrosine-type recombinase/integrase n=1 Tax=Acidovorax sp. SRB_14 TaxID=1962699 RepID=UPI0015630BEC|nr:tyrosine-type recombinase/integrase [Acidovorax sp. SRB_14]NMM79437.1 hypothetical protein [Acidovorax sp. SRB_14]
MQAHLPTHPLPNGTQVFARWLESEGGKPFQALSTEPQGVYETIWHAWLESLQPASGRRKSTHGAAQPALRQWHEARVEDVARFLRVRAGQKAHHQPDRTLSEVTRRRYWRVLDRVYDFAVQQRWLPTNPVALLRLAERPRAVDQLGHCLPPALWVRLPAHFPTADSLQGARDLAILLLLYELALAPEEVRALLDDSLLDAEHRPLAPASAVPPAFLRIEGARKAQQRTLALSHQVAAALSAWRQYRLAHDASLSGWLFHSRKGGPLSIRALFHVASKVIQEAHAALPSDVQQWPLQRVGPQVLRNTAIVTWLQTGVPESEVVHRIGVESSRALGHLQHKLAPVVATASAPPATTRPAP